jgi:DNA-binding transcriptional MerR regulator/methylmalonyl-CoA mutase cobalamin-binding subunit
MVKKTPEPTMDTVRRHPISVVAERTGLSRDVLRVWERRYGAVEPARTPGGQRLYSDEDVRRFRLLAAATKQGRSISSVARLSLAELARMVAEDAAARGVAATEAATVSYAHVAAAALVHARALDGSSLDRELRRAIALHGFPAFLEEIVPDLMRQIGDEWRAGHLNVAHEHLASAAVLAVVFEAIRAVPETPSAPRLLVATPSGEHHAVGSALAAATAALEGWTIVYLGVDVPSSDIAAAAVATGARAVALSVVYRDEPAHVVRELRALRAKLPPQVQLVVGGAAAAQLKTALADQPIVFCDSVAGMKHALAGEPVAA